MHATIIRNTLAPLKGLETSVEVRRFITNARSLVTIHRYAPISCEHANALAIPLYA